MTVDPKSETTADQASDFVSLPRRQLLVALSGVLLALLLAALSQTIVATAMPRIIIDLGGFDRYTWATTSYLVASAVAIPIVGRLSDLYGRRIFFLLGITIFMIGSIPTGLSQTMSQLIGFRAIQGLGRRNHHNHEPRGHRRPVSTTRSRQVSGTDRPRVRHGLGSRAYPGRVHHG